MSGREKQGGCIESSRTEGPFMLCLCLCTGGLHSKAPSILRDKLQHEARKHYGPSEVVMRLQLLRKQSNTGTSTRLAKFT